jgi:hypothetical protein
MGYCVEIRFCTLFHVAKIIPAENLVTSTKVLYKECLIWYNLTSTGAQAPGISQNLQSPAGRPQLQKRPGFQPPWSSKAVGFSAAKCDFEICPTNTLQNWKEKT